jgi:phenylpyruvate tautomerase PptA (4-oxalocrotonate tautomerase family)
MPIVHVHVRAGRPAAERKAILDGVHAALVEAFRIPAQDCNQILHEHAAENFQAAKGPSFTLVEVTAFPGRSLDAKRALYAAIVRNLEAAAGIPPAAVMIVLHEPSMESWGIRGGQAATDVKLGFEVKV